MTQEEVADKAVHLAIVTGKFSLQTLLRGMRAFVDKYKQGKLAEPKEETKSGKQTVKQLSGQGQRLSSMEIGDEGVRDFFKTVKKHGVDYAIVKDKKTKNARYTVFFKANDTEVFDLIVNDCINKHLHMGKDDPDREKPSILAALKKIKEMLAKAPKKIREKKKEIDR